MQKIDSQLLLQKELSGGAHVLSQSIVPGCAFAAYAWAMTRVATPPDGSAATPLFFKGISLALPAVATMLYVVMCLVGPRVMRDRQPFELKGIMLSYNAYQAFFSAWSVFIFIREIHRIGAGYWGNTGAGLGHPEWLTDARYGQLMCVLWLHYNNKYMELLDSVFMILRKKNEQLSFLHCYHHALLIWCVLSQSRLPVPALTARRGILSCPAAHGIIYASWRSTCSTQRAVAAGFCTLLTTDIPPPPGPGLSRFRRWLAATLTSVRRGLLAALDPHCLGIFPYDPRPASVGAAAGISPTPLTPPHANARRRGHVQQHHPRDHVRVLLHGGARRALPLEEVHHAGTSGPLHGSPGTPRLRLARFLPGAVAYAARMDSAPAPALAPQAQLLQFVVCLVHSVYILRKGCCGVFLPASQLFVMVNMLVLFGQFYVKAYSKKREDAAARRAGKKAQ